MWLTFRGGVQLVYPYCTLESWFLYHCYPYSYNSFTPTILHPHLNFSTRLHSLLFPPHFHIHSYMLILLVLTSFTYLNPLLPLLYIYIYSWLLIHFSPQFLPPLHISLKFCYQTLIPHASTSTSYLLHNSPTTLYFIWTLQFIHYPL